MYTKCHSQALVSFPLSLYTLNGCWHDIYNHSTYHAYDDITSHVHVCSSVAHAILSSSNNNQYTALQVQLSLKSRRMYIDLEKAFFPWLVWYNFVFLACACTICYCWWWGTQIIIQACSQERKATCSVYRVEVNRALYSCMFADDILCTAWEA